MFVVLMRDREDNYYYSGATINIIMLLSDSFHNKGLDDIMRPGDEEILAETSR